MDVIALLRDITRLTLTDLTAALTALTSLTALALALALCPIEMLNSPCPKSFVPILIVLASMPELTIDR